MKTNKDLIIEPNAAIEGRKYREEKDRNRDRDITRGKDLALHVRTRNKY